MIKHPQAYHMRRMRAKRRAGLAKRGCAVAGCPFGHYAIGYCERHYDKRRRVKAVAVKQYTTGDTTMLQDILIKASGLFDVPIRLITGYSRVPRHCEARFAVYYAMVSRRWSRHEVGAALGGRDHTTVSWGLARAAELAQADAWYAERLAALL